jgi:hypothetical protein
MNGGISVTESFTSTTRRLTGEVAEDLIVDKTMKILEDAYRENQDFEESYQGLGHSVSKTSFPGQNDKATKSVDFGKLGGMVADPSAEVIRTMGDVNAP